MKKTAFIPLFAVLTLLTLSLFPFTSATSNELVEWATVEFNGVTLGDDVMNGYVDDTVPVKVSFKSLAYAENVEVEVRMKGHRDDVSASEKISRIFEGKVYTELFNLELPSELRENYKEFTLYVEISSSGKNDVFEYTVGMQRESHTLEILSVDYSSEVSAGDSVPITVVVKNTGIDREDDAYVVVSIPALGVSTRGYLGDLVQSKFDSSVFEDEEDSIEKTVYLNIPKSAENGIYELELEVYNLDVRSKATTRISVEDSSKETSVYAAMENQNINAGESATYELILVNTDDSVKVYHLTSVSGDFLSVSAPSVVTVGPESSKTVPFTVTASEDAPEGSYTFSVGVDGEEAVYGANVEGSSSVSTSVVALTVILIIIFVVLLAVLVVLLTRKERPIEEVETSYY